MLNEIFNNILYILQFIVVGIMCFRLKHVISYKKTIALIIVTVVVTIILHYVNNPLLQFPITFFYALCSLIFIFKEKKKFLLTYTISMIVAFSMLNMMVEMVLLCIISLIKNQIVSDINNVYALFGSLVLLIGMGSVVRCSSNKSIRQLKWKYIILFSVLLVVDSIVAISLGDLALTSFKDSILYNISYILVVIGIFIQITMVIWFMQSREVYKEKEILARRYLESQVEHYSYLEDRERETKKFRHDIRSHIHMLSVLHKEKNYEAFEQYIEEMQGRIEQFGAKVCVDNGIVDAILNAYYDEALKKGIQLKVEGRFPAECKVSAFDLCTIFSNLLSNAIRAEEACDGKEIRVICRYDDTTIMVLVENDYAEIEKDTNGRLKTNKPDEYNHGFGLENVRECVSRNHGCMDIKTDENRFRVLLSLGNI